MNEIKNLKEFIKQDPRCNSEYIVELILENEKFDYLKSDKLNGMRISNDMIGLEFDGDNILTLDQFLSDYNYEFWNIVLHLINSFENKESEGEENE